MDLTSNSSNFFAPYDWNTILSMNPHHEYNIQAYHNILCPPQNRPDFLDKYINLPVMQRLKGIGLLCGTDWTALYKNRFYYSRLDHSIGVALIIWNFTHNKAQTLAGLFHDISTPVFSHVSDFRKGDALTQTATEGPTAFIIKNDLELQKLLQQDGLTSDDVDDYHKYPIADNEIPQLSADRLEYMFPSGMALEGSWTMEETAEAYRDISVLENENGEPELGFNTIEIAENYCRRFCMTGHVLQLNENKLSLQLLGQIMNMAVQEKVLSEQDFMELSEAEIIKKIEMMSCSQQLQSFYTTFRTMTEVKHTDCQLPGHFCISLKVKQRYINPLVKTEKGTFRLSEVSSDINKLIQDFLSFEDTLWGCVELVKP